MITFIALAAILIVASVGLVAVPLLKRAPTQIAPAPWAALAAACMLMIGSAALYVMLSNWSWRAQSPADSPQTMVARLARKLERDPQDLNGWLMLGRSYVVLEQYPLALRAFERADRLAGGKNAAALVGEAEALALNNQAELDGRAGRLIEQALALDPNAGKALFFGAVAAERRGELPLARERFAKLLATNPPDNIKPLLQKQIAALDAQLSGGSRSAAAGATSAPVAANGSTPAVRVNVELSPALSSLRPAAAPLFVFVRDPAQAGPPLAVKRLDSHFPQTVELTSSDSMVPGRAFAAGQKVQVVARIARSGNPVAASGDPFGEVAYLVGRDGMVNIVIDRITP